MMLARLAALVVGVTVAGIMVVLATALIVRIVLPDWYAVPLALGGMTGQTVSPAPVPAQAQERRQAGDIDTGPGSASDDPDEEDAASGSEPFTSPEAVPRAVGAPVRQNETGPLLPSRRFNVLLLGSDNDRKFSPEAVLTQSMILVSIDPTSTDVAMISIPRDFWVPIANYGYQKIDVAYEVGGISLARSTVERLFELKVDYYAWVGLDGLVKVIDTLGGIDVTVQHPILDETYPDDLNSDDPYAYFRLYIPAGPQHLDGTTTLQYVRSRHGDLQSDFGRSARQQQVLLAVKSRTQTLSLLTHIPRLVTDLQGSVKTDLTLPAVVQLATLARKVSADTIHQQVLSAPEFASLGYSPDGRQQVVYPDWAAIRPVVARLVGQASPAASDVAHQRR